MNLKKAAFTLVAAGAMVASSLGGAFAQTASDSTTGTVVVAHSGDAFDAQFCDVALFDGVSINSHNAANASTTGTVEICYTDNQPHRGVFRTYMQAGNFNGNGFNIPAEGLSPAYMYNVASGQWGGTHGNNDYVGGIGAMKGNAVYSSGPGGYVNGTSNEGEWIGGNLSEPQYVGYGNAGIGTGGKMYLPYVGGNTIPQLEAGSIATMDLKLNIPANTPAGSYVSTFTLNVYNQAP